MKIPQKLIPILLLCCLLCGSASAQSVCEYIVRPFAYDVQAMLEVTFGADAGKAVRDTTRDDVFFQLPGREDAAACSMQDHSFFQQSTGWLYKVCPADHRHEQGNWDNFEPVGVAKCALTREGAIGKATLVAEWLQLGEVSLQSVRAYGKLSSATGDYRVIFRQQLNGCPVYWAATNVNSDGNYPETNLATFSFCDSGLFDADINWSRFESSALAEEAMTAEDAIAKFVAFGVAADEAELCYLMQPSEGGAVATPAYRYHNAYLHAVTGMRLQ